MKKIKPQKIGYGLIGESLAHSYSPEIHQALGQYSFDLWELSPQELPVFLAARKFNGAMVTIPYKKQALAAADKVTPQAKALGAANILFFDEDGFLWADNTDYDGFIYMANRMGLSFKDKRVLILGDGATSGTVCQAIKGLDAASIKVASRHPEKYTALDLDENPTILGYDGDFTQEEIVVNTTSVGMYPNNGVKLISLKKMDALEGVIDLIYNPFATALLLEAKDMGLKTSNGFPMLVAQATKGAKHFMNNQLPDGRSWEEWNEILINDFEAQYSNKVIIGMPGSGKTTLGRALAKELNREFVDTDQLIEKREGRSIPEIFEKNGEAYFRRLEVEIAKEIGKEKSLVISTGGGMVLQKDVMDALRQNGEVIWIRAPLEKLHREGRPLSSGVEAVKELWEQRQPLYNKYADKIVDRD